MFLLANEAGNHMFQWMQKYSENIELIQFELQYDMCNEYFCNMILFVTYIVTYNYMNKMAKETRIQ